MYRLIHWYFIGISCCGGWGIGTAIREGNYDRINLGMPLLVCIASTIGAGILADAKWWKKKWEKDEALQDNMFRFTR